MAKKELQEDDTLLIESDLIFDDTLFPMILNDPYPNLALVAKYETWMDGTMVRLDDENNIVNFIPKESFQITVMWIVITRRSISISSARSFHVPITFHFWKPIRKRWVTMNIMNRSFG